MLKNSIIVVLLAVLAIVIYKYLTVYDISHLETERDVASANDTGIMKLWAHGYNFLVESEDKNFSFLFMYDENGLQSFSISDKLTDKDVYFNFYHDGKVANYSIYAKNYIAKTNIGRIDLDPDIENLVIREEWSGGYVTLYELFPDGSTNINVEIDKFWKQE